MSLRKKIAESVASATSRVRGDAAKPAASTPTANLAKLFPSLGKKASAPDIRARAEQILIEAMRAEFAREGLQYVDLSPSWTRSDLNDAQLDADPEYVKFMDVTLKALALRTCPVPSERELAAILEDPASADHFGFTLEATAPVVVFLAGRAEILEAGAEVVEDAHAALEKRLAGFEDNARAQLVKMVTVPQELRAAVQRADSSEPASEKTSSAGSRTGEGAEGASGTSPFALPVDLSMADLLRLANKAQKFFKTEEGQQALKYGNAAYEAGRNYVKKRSAKK